MTRLNVTTRCVSACLGPSHSQSFPESIAQIMMQHNSFNMAAMPTNNLQTISDSSKVASEKYDCTPCRIMGATVFTGLGTYAYFAGHYNLRTEHAERLRLGKQPLRWMGARRGGVTTLAATLVGLGLYRLVN